MSSVYDKYGVPTADGALEAPIQPKLSYRFKVAFVGFGGLTDTFGLTKNVVSAAIPNFEQEPQEIDSYVSRYYVFGKHTFGTFNVTLRNDANNTVANIVQAQLDSQHNAFEQSNAPNAGAVKFNTKILMLDGSNGEDVQILEGWHMTGCWLSSVEWGELNYSEGSPVQISLTIRPDNSFHIVDQELMGDEESVSFTNSTAATEGTEISSTGNTSAV
ncbi:hypothetical protein PBI_SCTP2_447 [Salicola phage SCTP-2]|nr:hypothetical protein PBI_SCTP2_447 [Salicola phage SCTP-2]